MIPFSFSGAAYASSDQSLIDVTIVLKQGDAPMRYTAGRADPHSADLYAACLAAGNIGAYAEPVLSPAEQRASALSAGVAITSALTPALNATYGISMQDEINLTGLQASILAGVPWRGFYRDITGARRMMTGAQFTALATAVMGYISAFSDAYETALGGGAATYPASTIALSV